MIRVILIMVIGILLALGLMLTMYALAYRYYRKSPPANHRSDRGPG
jgi:hypothetical protein